MKNIAKQRKILLLWNGMTSKQVSGGDIYIKQVVEHSKDSFDVIQSNHSKNLIESKNTQTVLNTGSSEPTSNIGIVLTYLKRGISSFFFVGKLQEKDNNYAFVLASSPFICDLLPALRMKHAHRAVILFHLIPDRSAKSLSMKIRFALAKLEQKIALSIIKKHFDSVLVGNSEVKAAVEKLMPGKKLIIAHAGIDTSAFPGKGVKKNPNLGLFIGRLTSQKGVLDLVDIVADILKKQPEFRLEIIGDGPHRHLLEEKMQLAGMKAITILGFVDNTIKYQKLAEATFFLFPSYEEGWGIALAEGLYAECKSVCYELDHYQNIFGDYPTYVPIGDKAAFSKAVLTSYDHAPVKGQKKFIEQYDYAAVVTDVVSRISEDVE